MPELAAKRLVFIFTHRGEALGHAQAIGARWVLTQASISLTAWARAAARGWSHRAADGFTPTARQRAHCLGAGSCLRVEPVRAMVRGVAVVRDEMVRAMTGSGLKLGPAAGFTSSLLEAWRG